MTAGEIYRNLCEFRDNAQRAGMSPNEMKKCGVSIVEIPARVTGDGASSNKYIGEDSGYVIEDYWYSDHCKTFDTRPDTNHFGVSLYDEAGTVIETKSFCYDDDR